MPPTLYQLRKLATSDLKRYQGQAAPKITKSKELNDLVSYLRSQGFTVSFVGNKVLHDYAGMNPEYAGLTHWPSGKKEFEIDKHLSLKKQIGNLRHEIIEYNLMRERTPYAQAHLTALKLEKAPLGIKEINTLAKLGKYEVVHVHDDGDLTISKGKKNYVVTTEGRLFKEGQV